MFLNSCYFKIDQKSIDVTKKCTMDWPPKPWIEICYTLLEIAINVFPSARARLLWIGSIGRARQGSSHGQGGPRKA